MDGWVKFHRKAYDNFLYKEHRPHTRREAWEDIIAMVNFEDAEFLIGNIKIECKRGQSVMSLESWGKIFNWDKSKVKRFFDLLSNEKMIVTENLSKTTRITICNYEQYQGDRNADETLMKRKRNADETLMKPIKEEEERKEEIRILYGQFISEFNRITGKKFQGTKPDKVHFEARIKEGFTIDQFITAITNCKNDKYHIENPHFLTPEFITRPDKLQRYLNAMPTNPQIPKSSEDNRYKPNPEWVGN
jgi:uncharacterized phage protein (TIGR02220 family)